MGNTLSERLADRLGKYASTDPDWRQTVYDHKRYLLDNSTSYSITEAASMEYNYRLYTYLKSVHNYDTSAAWIIEMLNEIGPSEFVGAFTLKIPDISVINDLYEKYQTMQSMINED